MNFSQALVHLKIGDKAFRTGWNGARQTLGLQTPDENSANTLPYIFIITVDGKRVPWVASQTDLLSEDWEVIENTGVGADTSANTAQGTA